MGCHIESNALHVLGGIQCGVLQACRLCGVRKAGYHQEHVGHYFQYDNPLFVCSFFVVKRSVFAYLWTQFPWRTSSTQICGVLPLLSNEVRGNFGFLQSSACNFHVLRWTRQIQSGSCNILHTYGHSRRPLVGPKSPTQVRPPTTKHIGIPPNLRCAYS